MLEAGEDGGLAPGKQEEVGGGEFNLVENGDLAAFCKEIKAQGPTERISRKPSRRFHANVIHSVNGSPLRSRKKLIFWRVYLHSALHKYFNSFSPPII